MGPLPRVRTHVGTGPWSLDSGVAGPKHQRKYTTKISTADGSNRLNAKLESQGEQRIDPKQAGPRCTQMPA